MAKKNRKNRGRIRNVVEPFSPKQIRRETNARVRLEFGEAQRALRGDLRASQQQSKNLNAWYQQYQDNMEKLRSGQLANTNALQEQSRKSAEAVGNAAAAQRQALDAEEDRSAALRGASTSGAGATEAAGETQRQALMTSTRDRNAQIGSSAYNRLSEVNAAAELGRQADQRRERGTRLVTQSKLRDLKRDKGAARTKYRADIIREERDSDLQRKTLKKDYGYQDAMRYVADQGVARAQASAAGQVQTAGIYSNAKIKSAKIYARGQNGQAIKGQDIRVGMSALRKMVSDGQRNPNWVNKNRQQVRDALIIDEKMDPKLANIVLRRYLNLGPRKGSSKWAKEKAKRSGR